MTVLGSQALQLGKDVKNFLNYDLVIPSVMLPSDTGSS